MQKSLILKLFICFLINAIKAEYTKYNLVIYNKLTYNGENETITIVDISGINENDIYINYKIQNNKFTNNNLRYIFTDDYPNNNTNFDFKGPINSIDSKESNNEYTLYFKIKKENKKYLILENLRGLAPGNIEIENTKSGSKAVIIIAIISLFLLIGIIGAFIFIGKYIFDKRQKELMKNYASSFVDENPSLVPNGNNQEESNANKLDE